MSFQLSEKAQRALNSGAVKLETFQYQKGQNKGKVGVKFNFEGTGWQGTSPFIVRQILANSQLFAELTALDDRELIAIAQMNSLGDAQQTQARVVGELGAETTVFTAPAQALPSAQPAPANDASAQILALLQGFDKRMTALESFTQAAQ